MVNNLSLRLTGGIGSVCRGGEPPLECRVRFNIASWLQRVSRLEKRFLVMSGILYGRQFTAIHAGRSLPILLFNVTSEKVAEIQDEHVILIRRPESKPAACHRLARRVTIRQSLCPAPEMAFQNLP
jgi:hypothetical protein